MCHLVLRPWSRGVVRSLGVFWLAVLLSTTARGETPLRQRIDQAIAARAGGPVAARCDDAEFVRRVSLDLAGVIPTAAEVKQFLADADPQKREKLIDKLLASPDYARRMQQAFSVMWLERRDGKAVADKDWNEYLRLSFEANKPWDQLCREVLGADGRDPLTRPALKLFVDASKQDQHQMTQDVARLFLGMNLQCAQCHDHPTVKTYKQADYFGLYAFLSQIKPHTNPQTKQPFLFDTAGMVKVDFKSVFIPDEKNSTGPRLPGGKEMAVPMFEKGQELEQPAQDGLPAIPKFRPRQLLADELPAATNSRFVQNSVNRLWFLLMGRGLVHPLDMLHEANPPSHPELLDALCAEFVQHKFNMKHLLREMALSETYQRSSQLPAGIAVKDAPPEKYRVANVKPLSAEQLAWSLLMGTGNLQRWLETPVEAGSKFTYNDYVNGRIKSPPANLPETLTLFGAVFGNPPAEPEVEFAPSMGGALFLMNERLVLQWLEPKEGNLLDRVSKLTDPDDITQELYLSLLSRRPTAEEQAEFAAYLQKHSARRAAALTELAWVLLASAEFRLNH